VDGSAGVQTVDRNVLPRFAGLLETFERRTGCPLLLNTSFNMRDEPIVCTPTDAVICFLRAGIESLVIEDFIVDRDALGPMWDGLLARAFKAQDVKGTISHLVYSFE
jgi:carbamoyltransferase